MAQTQFNNVFLHLQTISREEENFGALIILNCPGRRHDSFSYCQLHYITSMGHSSSSSSGFFEAGLGLRSVNSRK